MPDAISSRQIQAKIGFRLEEASTPLYASLDLAYITSVPFVAPLLAAAIHVGLASGRYVVQDGVVVLAEQCTISHDEPMSASPR